MKKYIVVLLAAIFIISAACLSFAGHERVIPYDSIFGHNPFPDAGDLRYHIITHMPYKEWVKWPGKGEMFTGSEPHGSFRTIYVNDIAEKSIKDQKGMANNSIVIKESYAPNKQLIAVTAMYKVKGYNPDQGDWFWAKYDAKFNMLAEGKIKDCLNCHSTVKDNDYIFIGKVK